MDYHGHFFKWSSVSNACSVVVCLLVSGQLSLTSVRETKTKCLAEVMQCEGFSQNVSLQE